MQDIKPNLEKQLDNLREPFAAFIGAQATASGLLLLALVAAIVLTNSDWHTQLEAVQHFQLGLLFGEHSWQWSLQHLVNDGLIAIFFFLIGLEVKRELLVDELQDRQRVGLLIGAATGGMLVPAGIYLLVNQGLAGGDAHGWGVPMATDTALAIGVLAALGRRVPRSAVTFLVGVAIVDDIGAILVIASAYTQHLDWLPLGIAGVFFLLLLVFNRAGLRHPLFYLVTGVALWASVVESGIHASIAGVIIAASVPARPRIGPGRLRQRMRKVLGHMDSELSYTEVLANPGTHERIARVERVARAATTPLRRWENDLELPVALLILPLFALLNAGVTIDTETLRNALLDPVSLGILLGLSLGKPIGLMLGVRVTELLRLGRRPPGLSDARLLGLGLLAGVGFTMSTFIGHLAFAGERTQLDAAKLAIVLASAVSALAGFAALRSAASPATDDIVESSADGRAAG